MKLFFISLCSFLGAVSPAIAQTWMPSGQTGNWYGLASSADGSKLVAVGYSGIYTSTNSGNAWIQSTNAPNLNWVSVASSADGNTLAAVSRSGPIYASTNGGAVWVQSDSPSIVWAAIASSADGTRMVAAEGYPGQGYIYTSADSGMRSEERRVGKECNR